MPLHDQQLAMNARTGVNDFSAARASGHHRCSAPFDDAIDTLTSNGYSGLALVRKRPIDEKWERWCNVPPTVEEIAARKGDRYNIGVACGYNGFLAIDVDTDRPEIAAAIRRVIPASPVAKRGQRGWTEIGRTSRPVASQRFYGPDGEILVEVLGNGRQTAVPNSIHPDTLKPYEWMGSATLLNTPLAELPLWPDDIGERIRKELTAFLAPEKTPRPQVSGPPILTDTMRKRHRAWALASVAARVEELAVMPPKSGRNKAGFKLAAAMGKFVHHGIITDAELRQPMMEAWGTDGLVKENGRRDCENTIDNGLRYALSDALQDLPDRPGGQTPRGARNAKAAATGGSASDARADAGPGSEQAKDAASPANRAADATPCVANEDAIATAFAERCGNEFRYCHDWSAWLRWDGSRWERERRKLAFHYARELAREANTDGKAMPAKASTAAGVERFAQADPRLATISETWDQYPWLLATPDGTVDLRSGKLGPARRTDYITKRAAVAPAKPGTPTPVWDAFLADATRNDTDLVAYLQRVAGYSLTGDTSEQALFFIYGDGGNGKGVFLNTLTRILDDCAVVASMDTFAASKGDRHPTDLAMLRGARLVTAQETEEGRAWSEVRIKTLTGGDPITARFMRQDFFTFDPTFKLVIAGNHKPNLGSVDNSVRRRFNIIPFANKPQNPDPQLSEKLKAEYPGILRWCIDGCLAWQRQGLQPPNVVSAATDAYFDEQDLFGRWLDECCEIGPSKSETRAALFASWKTWAEANGEPAGSAKDFTPRLLKVGIDKIESVKNTPGAHGKRGFKGVCLKPMDTSKQWQNQNDR